MTEFYDSIGATYNTTRHADPRLEQVIWSALGDCHSVLNVGAGTGAYEPTDRTVVAIEPSATMRRARAEGSAPCVAAAAESLPFDDRTFDAAMAILTVHHWKDHRTGLRELRRVARRCVLVVHCDQAVMEQLWLAGDGTWEARHRALLAQTELDCGYRLAVGRITAERTCRRS